MTRKGYKLTGPPAPCARCLKERQLTLRRICRPCSSVLQARGELSSYPMQQVQHPVKSSEDIRQELRTQSQRTNEGCWIWSKSPTRGNYTAVSVGGRKIRSHRASHEAFVGPIPDGFEVDHVCHNRSTTCPGGDTCLHRRCVNPEHLEAVPGLVNTQRAKARVNHCRNGHEFTEENTRWVRRRNARTHRDCWICYRDRDRAYNERKRARRHEQGDV